MTWQGGSTEWVRLCVTRLDHFLSARYPCITKLPWREAGPPNHHDDKVDSDQYLKGAFARVGALVRDEAGGLRETLAALPALVRQVTRMLPERKRDLRTTTSHKCAVVPRRARVQGS